MRQIIINLDSSDKTLIFRETIRQGENLGSEIIVNLNGEFTGYHYLMRFKLNNNNEVVTPELTVVNNQVKYPVPVILSAQAGVLRVEFEAYEVISEGNTRVIKSAITTLPVAESLNGNVEIIPEDYVPWYTQAVEQATIATTQAGIATTKAEEAAQSATDAATAVSTHNTSETAHTDIRELITDIETNKADKAKMFYPDNIYGGKLVDNINTISVTGFYTAYGSSVGVPYTYVSWYIQHINSSVGVASAYQKIVSFDKVYVLYRYKIANVWGAFTPLPASQIGLADAGNLITATNVEGALQENRTQINNLSTQQSQVLTNTEAEKQQQLASNYMKRIEDYANIISMPNNASGGIDFSLGGMTGKQEVINGNFANGIIGWSASNSTLSTSNKILTVTGTGTSDIVGVSKSSVGKIGNTFFTRAKIRVIDSLCNSIRIRFGDGSTQKVQTSPIQNQWYDIYAKGTCGNVNLVIYATYADATTALNKVMEVQEVMVIDMGTDISNPNYNLTADQMNAKYPNYFEGTKNVCGSGKMVFKGKNLFDGILESGTILSTGANGTDITRIRSKNFIKIQALKHSIWNSLSYSLVRYAYYDLNKNFISEGSPIVSPPINTVYMKFALNGTDTTVKVMLNKGDASLPYEPYVENTTYVQAKENNLIVENKMLPNLIKDEFYFNKVIGKWKRKQNVSGDYNFNGSESWLYNAGYGGETYYTFYIANWFSGKNAILGTNANGLGISNDGNFPINASLNDLKRSIIFGTSLALWIMVEKTKIDVMAGATTLDKFKTYLNIYPIMVTYQLATPIITDIDSIGEPRAYPSGSAEFTPCLWGYTSTASTIITDVRYPIKAITKVTKLDVVKGKLVETDVTADATISTDLLSLNIANIDVTKSYFYECEIDSQYSTNSNKVLDVEVDNGVITHDYLASVADWVLSANEANATMLVCNNSGGASKIIAPAKDGKTYVIRNTSGQTITVKTTSSIGITVANGFTETVSYTGIDYVKIAKDTQKIATDVEVNKFPATNLVPNGDFSKGTTGWVVVPTVVTTDSVLVPHSIKYSPVAQTAYIYKDISCSITDKLYIKGKLYLLSSSGNLDFLSIRNYGSPSNVTSIYADISKLNQWQTVSTIINGKTEQGIRLYIGNSSATLTAVYHADDVFVINLTTIFGANNEPTATEMDAILSKFPNGWFDGTVEQLLSLKEIFNFMLKQIRALQ